MAEYIEKQLVLSKSQQDYLEGRYDYDEFVLVSDIESIPPADVRPVVRGEWVPEPDRHYHWHCSECGYTVGVVRMDCKYCPNCGSYNGADMRGGDAEWESTSSTNPE